MSAARWHPENPCGTLCRPEIPCRTGLDPCSIMEGWMPGCWQDWNGLEEVTEVTAFWGEGIGRNSHMLKLQELGGYDNDIRQEMSG